MTKKHLNMIALIILLLGQTILGPIGANRAFADDQLPAVDQDTSSDIDNSNGNSGNEDVLNLVNINDNNNNSTSPDTGDITITPPEEGEQCFDEAGEEADCEAPTDSTLIVNTLTVDSNLPADCNAEEAGAGKSDCRHVYVTKVDPTGATISGITFNTTRDNGKWGRTAISGTDGIATLEYVHNGNTYLTEANGDYKLCSVLEDGQPVTITTAKNGESGIVFQDNKDKHYTFVNAPDGMDCEGNTEEDETGQITIVKTFSDDSEAPYPVVTFKLFNNGVDTGTTADTDSTTGIATFTGLDFDNYYVEEVVSDEYVATYDKGDQTTPIEISKEHKEVVINVTNTRKENATATLIVDKTFAFAADQSSLEAEFTLESVFLGYKEKQTVKGGEQITFANLKPGVYSLTETKTPKDYLPFGIDTFTVKADGTFLHNGSNVYTKSIVNNTKLKGTIGIQKVDPNKKVFGLPKGLEGAKFKLVNNDTGEQLGDVQTTLVLTGLTTFSGVPYGTYRLIEVKAPKGYEINPAYAEENNGFLFTINDPAEAPIVVNNYKAGETPIAKVTVIKKYADLVDTDLEATFTITGPEGYGEKTGISIGKDGDSFAGLIPGDYTISETASGSGDHDTVGDITFTVDTEYQIVNVTGTSDWVTYNGDDHKFTIINPKKIKEPKGSLTINKTFVGEEAGGELAGEILEATFELLDSKKKPLDPARNETTDENGNVTFEDLAYGIYYVKEVSTHSYYKVDSDYENGKKVIVDSEEEKVVPVANNKKTGSLFVLKVDPNKAVWDITRYLSGAQFKLLDSDDNEHGGVQETVFGGALFKDIPYGTYKLIEIKAPEGYGINEDYDGEGKEITIPSQTGVELPDVLLGIWSGKLSNVQNVGLETVENTREISSVTLTKYEEGTDDGTVVPGAIFDLYKKRGIPYRSDRIVKTSLPTGDDGTITVSDLEKGDYYFVETAAPYGYEFVADVKTGSFTIAQHGDEKQVTVYNKLIPRGSVTLTKYNEDETERLNGATFAIYQGTGEDRVRIKVGEKNAWTTENVGTLTVSDLLIGHYQFVEIDAPTDYVRDERPISFEVTENSETGTIVKAYNTLAQGSVLLTKVSNDEERTPLQDAEFELQDKDGNTLQTGLVTGVDGKLQVDLAYGDYQFVETKAPKYHVLNDEPISFTLSEETPDGVLILDSIINVKGGDIIVEKVDAADNGIKLQGALFELLDDGVVIATATSGEDGIATFEGVRYGSYTFKEVSAPTGYLVIESEESIEVTLEEGTDESELITVENQKIHESFTVRKVNATNPEGLGLQGATFKVQVQVPMEGSEGPGVFVDVPEMSNLITNEVGVIPETKLEPGNYQLVEMIAPLGYALNSSPTPFTIVKDQATVVSLTVANSLLSTPPGPGPGTETGGGGGGGGVVDGTPPTTTIVSPTPQPQVPFIVVPRAPGVPVTVGEEPQPEGPNVTVPEEPQPEGPNVTVEEPEGPSVTVEEEPQPEGPSVMVEEEPQPEGPSVTVVEQPRPEAPRPTLPRTGEGVPVGVLAVGLALTLLGGWLLFGRRRKEDSQL